MKKLALAISATALAITAGFGVVHAQNAPAAPDRDHEMTWAEFKARADEGFAKLDVNHDGVIDQKDRAAMRDRMRDEPDKNHDAAHDPDGPPPPPPPGMGPDDDHRGGSSEWRRSGMSGGMGGGGMGGAMMFLRDADTNHDGKITRAEYDASVKARFDAMDTNHDGKISKDERKAARDKMRAEMRERMRAEGRERGDDMGDMHGGPRHGSGDDDMPPPPQ